MRRRLRDTVPFRIRTRRDRVAPNRCHTCGQTTEPACGSLADKRATPISLNARRGHKKSNGSSGHMSCSPSKGKSNSVGTGMFGATSEVIRGARSSAQTCPSRIDCRWNLAFARMPPWKEQADHVTAGLLVKTMRMRIQNATSCSSAEQAAIAEKTNGGHFGVHWNDKGSRIVFCGGNMRTATSFHLQCESLTPHVSAPLKFQDTRRAQYVSCNEDTASRVRRQEGMAK